MRHTAIQGTAERTDCTHPRIFVAIMLKIQISKRKKDEIGGDLRLVAISTACGYKYGLWLYLRLVVVSTACGCISSAAANCENKRAICSEWKSGPLSGKLVML
jgi:hypothetical protein